MRRLTRLSNLAVTGFSVLLVAGCAGGGSSSSDRTRQSAIGPFGQLATRLDGLPITTTTLAGEISGVTASGTLTCSNTTGMS